MAMSACIPARRSSTRSSHVWIVNCRTAGEFLRTFGVGSRSSGALQRPVNDERAAGCEHRNVVRKAGSCDWIDDGLDAATARDRLDALADLLIPAVDNIIGAKIAGKARLLVTADHTYNAQTRGLRQIDQRIAHAAGSSVDEHSLTRTQLQGIVEDVIGNLIIGERRRGLKTNIAGQKKGRFRRRHNVFDIMAAPMGPFARSGVDPLTGPTSCDAGADFLNRASEFGAGRRWQRWHVTVSPSADQTIRNADADSVRFD